MGYYRTERLYYKNYRELDEKLTDLHQRGWRVVVFRETKMGVDSGYESYVTFKVYD
jgi:hypothetical protein